MIYLVKCGECYKIGYTCRRKPDARISSMQTGNPFPISLVGFWEGSEKHEASLHEHFSARHVNGEWFALTSEDVATVEAIAKAIVTGETLIPESPKEPPRSRFPEGLDVEVEGCACGGCGYWVHFVGSLDYVVCKSRCCNGYKHPLEAYMRRRDHRKAMTAVIHAHKL
jgi:hypothetical protein